LQRYFMGMHVWFYQRTGGGLGGKLAGRSMLLLTTIGRKSGQQRVTPIFYFPDNGRFVLIGSDGGAPSHPQWWRNLQANSQAKVQIGRSIMDVAAHEAVGEERERLWSSVTARYPEFLSYQRRTTREIPVVVLSLVG
jgi:deazaflavin-dependent oxidoreductase (nitroreductase family)